MSFPRKYQNSVSYSDVKLLATDQVLCFSEKEGGWDASQGDPTNKSLDQDSMLFVNRSVKGGIGLEFWRRADLLFRLTTRTDESLSQWRNGKRHLYYVQYIEAANGSLTFGSAKGLKSYQVDAIASFSTRRNWRTFIRGRTTYDIVIEVGGNEHIIAYDIAPRSSDAIINLIFDYRQQAK